MEIFKNKFLVKLIATICLVLTLFNFAGTSKVYAEDEGLGGVLLKPVIHLITALGDGIVNILHRVALEQDYTLLKVKGLNGWERLLTTVAVIVVTIVAAVVIGAITFFTAGIGTAVLAAVTGTAFTVTAGMITTAALGAIGGAILVGFVATSAFFPDDIYLPLYQYSAEEIFSNELLLFDVNFFQPKSETEPITIENTVTVEFGQKIVFEDSIAENSTERPDWLELQGFFDDNSVLINSYGYTDPAHADLWGPKGDQSRPSKMLSDLTNASLNYIVNEINKDLKNENLSQIDKNNYLIEGWAYQGDMQYDSNDNPIKRILKYRYRLRSLTDLPVFYIDFERNSFAENPGPAKIKIVREAGSFKGIEYINTTKEVKSTAGQLSGMISKWYVILRNVSLLVLMLILIYSGIRIVIGSTAGEKAKYKERIMDWLVAMCLIFVMHYIMAFSVQIVEKITDLVDTLVPETFNTMAIRLSNDQKKSIDKADWENAGLDKDKLMIDDSNAESGKTLLWQTNLMGMFRLKAQFEKEDTEQWIGYSFCFVILVLFTVFFTFTYIKRVIYMAFLTIIAPLVAMTYPIDKITDGKAQAFDMWLKEYIFNLMIQPLHLLLYTILVTCAYKFATENPIYALVAIGFMMPAEKLMRKFFGFEKAKTPGLLGGAAGAAIAMSGLQSLTKHSHKGRSHSEGDNEKEKSSDIKFSNSRGESTYDTLLEHGEKPFSTSKQTGNVKTVQAKPRQASVPKVAQQGNVRTVLSTPKQTSVPKVAQQVGNVKRIQAKPKQLSASASRMPIQQQPKEKDGFWRRTPTRRTIAGVTGAYARGLGNKALKRIQKGKPIKSLARKVAGLYGGALLGAAGLALGVASGDPSKAFQYTTTGAVGGYAFGKGLSDKVSDTFSVNDKDMEKEAEMAWYGEDYKDAKYNEAVEEDLMSDKNINYIRQVTGCTRKEAKEVLDGTGRECYSKGIRDVEDILAIDKVVSEEKDKDPDKRVTMDQAIAATKLKNNLPQKIKNMSSKKLQEYQDTYAEKYKKILEEKHRDGLEQKYEEEVKRDKKFKNKTEKERNEEVNKRVNQALNNESVKKAQETIKLMNYLDKTKSSLTDV